MSSQLVVIDEGFDAELLHPGHVYFLNRQKLTGSTYLTSGTDKRTYSLWDTLGNTIRSRVHTLYLILDEAHRGVGGTARKADEKERQTTILRLINGYNGSPPVPIVLGISATVQRFDRAMTNAKGRTKLPSIEVSSDAVRSSGLLKDTLTLDLPDEKGTFDTVLARAAAQECRAASARWEAYAESQGLAEPVRPLLVFQVPNKPSSTLVANLLDVIHDAWPELGPQGIANVFGEHQDEIYGAHVVPYIAPQEVQGADFVRVLLAKDAISTGWDCPRAEVLLSLRAAKDRTHITQLLGRLMRTPLARRIDADERLNAVTCYLPNFDRKTAIAVANVMTGADQDGEHASPPTAGRVLIDPVTVEINHDLPVDVFDRFLALPSVAAPKAPIKPTRRLLGFAAEIAIDTLLPAPSATAHARLASVLDGQRAQHATAVKARVEDILTADLRRITATSSGDDLSEDMYRLLADERTVDGAFRIATRTLGNATAREYAKRLALEDEEDADWLTAKATVAALAMTPGVPDEVDRVADDLADEWFAELHADIAALSDERRSAYDEIRQQARTPQPINIVMPTARIQMTYALSEGEKTRLPTRDRHLLADEHGQFSVEDLLDWEVDVLDTELARKGTIAWYRNPSRASKDAVQIPWHDGERWRSLQPDFLVFARRSSGGIAPSIIDPHGHHLTDALGKLRGLADYTEVHGDVFTRIVAISDNRKGDLGKQLKGKLVMLDLKDPNTRTTIREAESAAAAYRDMGIEYR